MTNITDVGQLQNMVKKRDSIIVELKGELKPVTAESIDYEEVCIQLKAATYEITRLEEELLICQGARDHWEVIAKKSGDDAIELSKQLDQQTADRNEMEDKLHKTEDVVLIENELKIGGQTLIKKHLDTISILEEKLATCDEHYKLLRSKLDNVNYISKLDSNYELKKI